MKYFLYARKSSESEDRQMLSIEAQILELKEFAKRNNLEIVDIFTESMSAKQAGRPIFEKLIKELELNKVNGIIAWHPDRLARNMFDGGKLIHLIDQGIIQDLKFPNFYFDKTANGKFNLSIAFSQAQYFVDGLRENVKRGIRQKVRRGEYPGKAPYGYINNLKTKTIDPDSENFEVIQKLLIKFSETNMSQGEFRKELFDNGFKTKSGNLLSYSSLYHILRNPFYTGVFKLKDEIHQGAHKQMISKEVFDKIQKKLDAGWKVNITPEAKDKKNYLFQGFLTCGNCGYAVRPEWHQKKSVLIFKYYKCTRKSKTCNCTEPAINEKDLAQQVEAYIKPIALKDEYFEILNLEIDKWIQEEKAHTSKNLQKVNTQITKVKSSLDNLLDLQLENVISLEEYKAKKNKLINHKLDLEAKFNKISSKGSAWVEPTQDFLKTCNNANKSLLSKDFKQMAQILKKVGLNHKLSNKKLDIQFSKSYDFFVEIQSLTNCSGNPVKIHNNKNLEKQTDSACSRMDGKQGLQSNCSNAVIERVSARRPKPNAVRLRAGIPQNQLGLSEWYRWSGSNRHSLAGTRF